MDWINIQLDYVNPLYLFDFFNEDDLKEVFNWIDTPLKNYSPEIQKIWILRM